MLKIPTEKKINTVCKPYILSVKTKKGVAKQYIMCNISRIVIDENNLQGKKAMIKFTEKGFFDCSKIGRNYIYVDIKHLPLFDGMDIEEHMPQKIEIHVME